MKTRINIATSNGYLLDNGKLIAYEFKSAKVNFATGYVEYDCILGGKPTTFKMYDGDCPKVYKDESAFQRGETCEETYSWSKLLCKTICSVPYKLDDDETYAIPYCIVNGEIVAKPFPKDGFVIGCGGHMHYEGDEKYYETRDEAVLHCDIVKVESDGTEVRCPSPASLVDLNEEQKKAVQAVDEALKKARELGVSFGYDIEDDEMFAYSNVHIKDTDWGYDDELITDFGYCINNLVTPMKNGYILSYIRCDSKLLVKFKEE